MNLYIEIHNIGRCRFSRHGLELYHLESYYSINYIKTQWIADPYIDFYSRKEVHTY